MRNYEFKGLEVPDFDYICEGKRSLYVPDIGGSIQVGTYEPRQGNALVETNKVDDELSFERVDGQKIQFTIGGYALFIEGMYSLDYKKVNADVFHKPVSNFRFIRSKDGLWNAEGDDLHLLNPNRLERITHVIGCFLVDRPLDIDTSRLEPYIPNQI